MKLRLPLAIVLVAAFAAGAWMALRPPEFDESAYAKPAVGEAHATAAPAPSKLGAATVLSIDPRANPLKAAEPAVPRQPSLFNEFQTARSYKAIYDRLKASGDAQTPEGWYVMYEILKRCANVTERNTRQPAARAADQKRDQFLASLPANDPQRDKRIAAFDDVSANRCAGMENVAVTQADLDKMLANAAAAGDPKAQALTIEQQLWAERRAAGPSARWGRDSVTLTDSQVSQLQQIANSRDPEAMVIAGRVLANNWHDFSMRIGGDQVIEQRAFNQAMQLLACDYGAACGEDNSRVLAACAYQGHCNASSLADYVYYYGSSPYDSQLLTQYREILRNAVETGNWSQISIVRGPTPGPATRFMFRRPGGG